MSRFMLSARNGLVTDNGSLFVGQAMQYIEWRFFYYLGDISYNVIVDILVPPDARACWDEVYQCIYRG